MSDVPDRRIAGLAPRNPARDLSILQRKNRPPQPANPATADVETAGEEVPELSERANATAAPSTVPESRKTRLPTLTADSSEDSGRIRQTIYLGVDVRDRARAAFRATQHAEGDRSWSEFVETAIRAETERREARHNGGTPYAPDPVALRPGRPLEN